MRAVNQSIRCTKLVHGSPASSQPTMRAPSTPRAGALSAASEPGGMHRLCAKYCMRTLRIKQLAAPWQQKLGRSTVGTQAAIRRRMCPLLMALRPGTPRLVQCLRHPSWYQSACEHSKGGHQTRKGSTQSPVLTIVQTRQRKVHGVAGCCCALPSAQTKQAKSHTAHPVSG